MRQAARLAQFDYRFVRDRLIRLGELGLALFVQSRNDGCRQPGATRGLFVGGPDVFGFPAPCNDQYHQLKQTLQPAIQPQRVTKLVGTFRDRGIRSQIA